MSTANCTASQLNTSTAGWTLPNQAQTQTQTTTGYTNLNGTYYYPNQLGYQWYAYPYYYSPQKYSPQKQSAAEIIELYKKQFGKEWKKYFAATVKIEL